MCVGIFPVQINRFGISCFIRIDRPNSDIRNIITKKILIEYFAGSATKLTQISVFCIIEGLR